MLDDRELLEKRIARELWERVLPLAHVDRRPLSVRAGSSPTRIDEPVAVGDRWGAPWDTTWFELSAEIPAAWRGGRVEAVIDLGFDPRAAGFQAEGMVVVLDPDGRATPVQGIHPRRTNVALAEDVIASGRVELLVEAASNPMFPQFRPSQLGRPDTAHDRPLYTFRRAELVLYDSEAEALAYDVEVLDGYLRSLHLDDPRRPRLLRSIVAALDALPDIGRARATLATWLDGAPQVAGAHRIIATGHAHIDTAWLWPMRETVRKCARTFASAVALMDDYPEYRFSCSQAQQYAWIEERHPELFARIAERVGDGRWVPVGGMWVEADMNLPSGESLARQIVFGQRYFEDRFGTRCREVWIPDVFGYPAGLPQLFAQGGMTRFVTQKLSWNKQNTFPHHTFWWEGLDGTRVLTHFPPVDTYNAEITPEEVAGSVANFKDAAWSTASLMPFGHGDGGGGPTREMLERARRLETLDPTRTLEVGTTDDLFEHVEREVRDGAPVPVWRGELYFETHRGTLTSQLRTKLGNRRCERLLVEAELWAATLGREIDLDDLWREVLTQQFHDILPGSSIGWVHDDAEEVFARVGAELERQIDEQLAAAAGTDVGADPSTQQIWLANRADVPVDGVVLVPADLVTGVRGGPASTQCLEDGSTALVASVPALSVAPLGEGAPVHPVTVTETSMANEHLAVRWDDAGNVFSIIDVAAAREIVPEGQVAAVLELAPDHPVEYDAWDLESWTRRAATALTASGRDPEADLAVSVDVVERGPLVGRVRVERIFGPSRSSVVYELRGGERLLRVHVEVDWQHAEHLLSMAFPIDVRTETAMCDVQFGVVGRPTHPSSPWDAAKFEVCAHRFVDLAEPDFGVAVLNDGRYGHCVFDGAIRVSLARAARYPDPRADGGRHAVTLALMPHGPGLDAVRAAAAALNAPPRALAGRATGGGPAAPVSVVGGDGRPAAGIEVDAVKLADDGSGDLVVRLHEACGRRQRITVAAARPVRLAQRCNLLEEPENSYETSDGVVALTLRPFQLVTLRLGLDPA